MTSLLKQIGNAQEARKLKFPNMLHLLLKWTHCILCMCY